MNSKEQARNVIESYLKALYRIRTPMEIEFFKKGFIESMKEIPDIEFLKYELPDSMYDRSAIESSLRWMLRDLD